MKKYHFGIWLWMCLCIILSCESIPDFSLKSLDGSTFKLSDHLGHRIIVIDFWATWCKPCKKLLKRLSEIYHKYSDRVLVISISIDNSSALSRVESYVRGKRFDFPVLLDTESTVARIFNPSLKLPFTMIIDLKGKLIYTHTGYMPGDEKEIIKQIEAVTK